MEHNVKNEIMCLNSLDLLESVALGGSRNARCLSHDDVNHLTDIHQIIGIPKSRIDSPVQLVIRVFPTKKYGKANRRFNVDCYKDFKWIEYRAAKDAVFCFAC